MYQVLNRLVETSNQSRMGGEFTVVDAGSGFHLVPTSRRGVGGEREPYTPPLSVRIDLTVEERSGLDTLTEIARLVFAQTGRPISEGMMPINLKLQRSWERLRGSAERNSACHPVARASPTPPLAVVSGPLRCG